MAAYEISQITDTTASDDFYAPLHLPPRISEDGSRIVFPEMLESGRPLYAIWLYDRSISDRPFQLTVYARGEEKILINEQPHISGDGRKIIFSAEGYYTSEDKTGVYIYDIETQSIRLVAEDQIHRGENGVATPPEEGMRKRVTSSPRISRDGQWIVYLLTEHIGSGPPYHGYWLPTRQRLIHANITESAIRGGVVLDIALDGSFGNGIRGLSISGNGRMITFYGGGVISRLEVENLRMPPYETRRHPDTSGPTCDVYCYAVQARGGAEYALRCIPDPQDTHSPLIVAHPYTAGINGLNVHNIQTQGPSISNLGSRIALNAGLVLGSRNTGVYISEPFGGRTHKVISFEEPPGDGPDNTVLTTGHVPAISPDGRWVAFQQTSLAFRHNYANPDEYVEGQTYCPKIVQEKVVVQQIPRGETSTILDSGFDMGWVDYSSRPGVSISNEAECVAINTRRNPTGNNPDCSHEIFLATLIPE